MKKILIILLLIPLLVSSQISTPNWSTQGITANSSHWFGTRNNLPLIFKVNNSEIGRFTSKGLSDFNFEYLTQTEIDAITNPKLGRKVFNTTTNKEMYFDGTLWIEVGAVKVNNGLQIDANTGEVVFGGALNQTTFLNLNEQQFFWSDSTRSYESYPEEIYTRVTDGTYTSTVAQTAGQIKLQATGSEINVNRTNIEIKTADSDEIKINQGDGNIKISGTKYDETNESPYLLTIDENGLLKRTNNNKIDGIFCYQKNPIQNLIFKNDGILPSITDAESLTDGIPAVNYKSNGTGVITFDNTGYAISGFGTQFANIISAGTTAIYQTTSVAFNSLYAPNLTSINDTFFDFVVGKKITLIIPLALHTSVAVQTLQANNTVTLIDSDALPATINFTKKTQNRNTTYLDANGNVIDDVATIALYEKLINSFVVAIKQCDTGIALTDLTATLPLLYNNTTGNFSIPQATTTTTGYLSFADWNTFNNKGTPFWLLGGNIDANSDKTSTIHRDGSLIINTGFLRCNTAGGGYSFNLDPTPVTGPILSLGTVSNNEQFFKMGAYNSQNNFDNKARDFQIFGNGITGIMVKATTGRVGIGNIAPTAQLSNTNTQINGSNGQSSSSNTGFAWTNTNAGWAGAFYSNATNNGLNVKATGTTATTTIFEAGTGTTSTTNNAGGGGSTMRFKVQGNGDSLFNGRVGVNTLNPVNSLSVQGLQYSTGTASQTLTTITGVGTAWTSAMIGSQFIFENGTSPISAGTITAVTNATTLTVSTSQTVASGAYQIQYTGLQSTSLGTLGVGVATPTATVHIQNQLASTATINADAQMFRMQRPETTNNKWGGIAQFNLGSYLTDGAARSRLDLAMADGTGNTLSNIATFQANGRLGINTTAPNTNLDVNGSFGSNIRTITATSTLLTNDHTVVITGTAITTQTLPTPNNRQYLELRNNSTGTATISGHINNVAATNYTLASNSTITLKSDGVTWWIMNETAREVVAVAYQTAATVNSTGSTSATAVDVLSITLPSSGRWRLRYTARGFNNTAGGGTSICITNAANVVQANSEVLVVFSASAVNVQHTAQGYYDVTTTAPNTVFKMRVYGVNIANSGATLSDQNGRTSITAEKIN